MGDIKKYRINEEGFEFDIILTRIDSIVVISIPQLNYSKYTSNSEIGSNLYWETKLGCHIQNEVDLKIVSRSLSKIFTTAPFE